MMKFIILALAVLAVVSVVSDDYADAETTVNQLMQQGKDSDACASLAKASIEEVKDSVKIAQKLADTVDDGSDCKNRGQSVVKAAKKTEADAMAAAEKTSEASSKACNAKVQLEPQTLSSIEASIQGSSSGSCNVATNDRNFQAANSKCKKAKQAFEKAKGFHSETKKAIKAAHAAAEKEKEVCLCKAKSAIAKFTKAFNKQQASGQNAKRWKQAHHMRCVLDGNKKCTFKGVPTVSLKTLTKEAKNLKCGPSPEELKKIADEKARKKQAAEKKAAEKKKAAAEKKKQQAAAGAKALSAAIEKFKAAKKKAIADAKPKDCTLMKGKCYRSSMHVIKEINDWPKLRKNTKGTMKGKQCGTFPDRNDDLYCSCQYFCQQNSGCSTFTLETERKRGGGQPVCSLLSRNCNRGATDGYRGSGEAARGGVCGGTKNVASIKVHTGPCQEGYAQVGTKSSSNDVHGKCMGQSCGTTMSQCAGKCGRTPGCKSYMWTKTATLGHCSGLCEICNNPAPNNSWGSDTLFCTKG